MVPLEAALHKGENTENLFVLSGENYGKILRQSVCVCVAAGCSCVLKEQFDILSCLFCKFEAKASSWSA